MRPLLAALPALLLLACPSPKEETGTGPVQDADGDGWALDDDCDDDDANVNPGADETCDGVDDDCDGATDEDVTSTWYADDDDDGYGDPSSTLEACDKPEGAVPTGTDCDDSNPDVFPSSPEVCDGVDNDCDGDVDEDLLDPFFLDGDGDGWGDPATPVEACEVPSGYVANDQDCDDADAATFPGAAEVCDGRDQDCDGATDEGVLSTWYADTDGDGFGDAATSTDACAAPTGFVAGATDCDDADATVHPDAPETCDDADDDCDGAVDEDLARTAWQDADLDGWGDASVSTETCHDVFGWTWVSGDCDDFDDAVHPTATEICNEKDDDCDGLTDEDDAADATAWYRDADGDGHGDAALETVACDAPAGYTSSADDCDDTNALAWPGLFEVCDGADNDCDGATDEEDALDPASWYADADADGWGDAAVVTEACDAPAGFVADATDCDDTEATTFPGAVETCDHADDDCDGAVDEAGATGASTWYADTDADGWGDAAVPTEACDAPAGFVADATDCDDAEATTFPGAVETCDGEDDDCDGLVDEPDATDAPTWYADADGDGWGDATSPSVACEPPPGTVADATDCDDSRAGVNPGAEERCDPLDNDCDGTVDEPDAADAPTWYADADGDGFGDASVPTVACDAPTGTVADATDCDDLDPFVHPGFREICNDVDDDCDGVVDGPDAVGALPWYLDEDGDGYGGGTTVRACDAPTGTTDLTLATDCNDTDPDVHPGYGCDWVLTLVVPGTAYLYVAADHETTVTVQGPASTDTLSIAADGVDDSLTLAAGTYTLRSTTPILAHVADTGTGGDMVATARDLDGSPLSTRLHTWAGEWLTVMNPSSTSTAVSVSRWIGHTWVPSGSATIAARSAEAFSVASGYWRVEADAPVTAAGAWVGNIENHLEYLPSLDGDWVGVEWLWSMPEVIGKVALSGLCVDAAGCNVEVFQDGASLSSHALAQGDTFYDYIAASSLYEVLADADLLVRDDATPRGFSASDGTNMDTDLVPGLSGDPYDTDFMLVSSLGTASTYPSRRTDLYVIGYRDGTHVEVMGRSGSSWTSLGSADLNAGDVVSVTDLDPATLVRFEANEPIHIQQSHTDAEFAWGAWSAHFAD